MRLPLSDRLSLLQRLRAYLQSDDEEWRETKEKASLYNSWFLPEFVDTSLEIIEKRFLAPEKLKALLPRQETQLPPEHPDTVGLVLSGQYPAADCKEFLCGFLTGQTLKIKIHPKDKILIPHFVEKLIEWEPRLEESLFLSDRLNGAGAYLISTGKRTDTYWKKYFGKHPMLLKSLTTSVAVLDGEETPEELKKLADYLFAFWGRSENNIKKVFVPKGYDFSSLFAAVSPYEWLRELHQYKNNYDYQLSKLLLNREKYLTNEWLLLRPSENLFAPIGVLNFQHYEDQEKLLHQLHTDDGIEHVFSFRKAPSEFIETWSLSNPSSPTDPFSFLMGLHS